MSTNPVVTLSEPVSPASLEASLGGNGRLQCSRRLPAADCEIVNAFLARNPDQLLRVFQDCETSRRFDLEFIADLPALRHAWIEANAGTLNDLSALRFLPQALVSLGLDTVAAHSDKTLDKPKTNASELSRFTQLDDLTICGRLHGLEFLGSLQALRKLALSRNKLKTLEGIEKLPRLEQLRLRACGAKSAAPLASLKALSSLEIEDQRGLTDLHALSEIPLLARLWLISCGRGLALPSFLGFRSLRVLVLHSVAGPASLEPVAQAPSLQCLVLSGSPEFRSVEAFQPLAGHPSLRELRIDSWSESLAKAITDKYGWKVAYANWPADEYLN